MNTHGRVQSSSVNRGTLGLQQILVVPVGGAAVPVESVAVALSNNTSQQPVESPGACSAARPAPTSVGPSVRILQTTIGEQAPVLDDREMRRRVSWLVNESNEALR